MSGKKIINSLIIFCLGIIAGFVLIAWLDKTVGRSDAYREWTGKIIVAPVAASADNFWLNCKSRVTGNSWRAINGMSKPRAQDLVRELNQESMGDLFWYVAPPGIEAKEEIISFKLPGGKLISDTVWLFREWEPVLLGGQSVKTGTAIH